MTDVIITSHFARTHKCILTIRKTAEPMEQNWQSKVQFKKSTSEVCVYLSFQEYNNELLLYHFFQIQLENKTI